MSSGTGSAGRSQDVPGAEPQTPTGDGGTPGAETGEDSTAPVDHKSKQAEEITAKWSAQAPRRIVLICGTVLAGCAGYVNATSFVACGFLVSHVTGTTAKLGMALEGYYTDDDPDFKIYQSVLLLLSFLTGASICGTLVSRNEVHLGKSAYGVALSLNSLLLLGAIGVFHSEVPEGWPAYAQSSHIAAYLQSTACGLQNGMCTAHYGAVVRTTHLTGLATDSGLTIGRLMNILLRNRCNPRNFCVLDWAELVVDLKKMVVFAALFTGYVVGCCIGASMAGWLGIDALIIPACITGLGGMTYALLKARLVHSLEQAEADKLARDLCEAEEIFERARQEVAEGRTSMWSGNSEEDFENYNAEVEKAFHLMQDMEKCLQSKLARRKTMNASALPLPDELSHKLGGYGVSRSWSARSEPEPMSPMTPMTPTSRFTNPEENPQEDNHDGPTVENGQPP
eukprot:TRINITY_DN33784_c0_g1_i1.p1 TRINITY_DN33784_c0_g1~~TRINITY_DN33784_c0_g1_i1.p1  ORF type:complete len:453 (-),score=78.81 TRINITY_DN33784_c0_g1_i1:236-1594(-)